MMMRLAIGAGAAMVAIAAGMVAITFVIIAIYELLETVMQPWLAALSTAGLAILVAAIVIVIARIVIKVAFPKHPAPSESAAERRASLACCWARKRVRSLKTIPGRPLVLSPY